MTSIAVTETQFQVDKRAWHLGGALFPGWTENATLDVSAFTAATHYPNGFLPSGLAVALITAATDTNHNVVGPYTAADTTTGLGTAFGLLFAPVRIPNTADTTVDVGGAVLVAFAPVRLSKLPIALDAAGQADLPRIHFSA